jgi:GTP-binding protein HflX
MKAGRGRRDVEARLDEAAGLAEAIGVNVADKLHFQDPPARPGDPVRLGPGRAIAEAVRQAEAELVIVDARSRRSSRRIWRPRPRPR